MNTVPAREVYKLDGAIVPQLFIERDGDIYFFDKINLHEGRFCRLQKEEVRVVLEVGEGQGIINHKGEMYLLEIGDSTVITKYNLDGQVEKTITIDGIFFDFKINDSGYFVLLGYVDNVTVVKILSGSGLDAGFLKPKNILFGSCIGLCDDDIYLGGFNEKNLFMLISMNYIGNIQNEWHIDINSEDRIIGKIQRYRNQILLLIVGKYDSLVVLNTEDGKYKELLPRDLGLGSFIDANIYGDRLQILDEKCIYTWSLDEIFNIRKGIKEEGRRDNFNPHSYQYLMYMMGLEKQIVSCFKISLMIMSTILIYLFHYKIFEGIRIDKVILLSFSCFWSINLIIASAKNLLGFMDKSKRIDELLNIYSLKEKGDLRLPLFMALSSISFYTLFLYPYINVLIIIFLGVIFLTITYAAKVRLIKNVMLQNESVSIELLNFEESRFGEYLRTVVETLKNKNCEAVSVDITLKRSITRGIIDKWINSRKSILGIVPKIFINDNKVKIEFNFSVRDIKYSRYSILMDYICYIESETDIEEIQIGLLEDKG